MADRTGDIGVDMDAAAKTSPGPSTVDFSRRVNAPSTSSGLSASDRQRKEERLIALYMDLTGASETAARSVYMHLGLNRDQPPNGGN